MVHLTELPQSGCNNYTFHLSNDPYCLLLKSVFAFLYISFLFFHSQITFQEQALKLWLFYDFNFSSHLYDSLLLLSLISILHKD